MLTIAVEDGHVLDPKEVPVEPNTAIRFEAVSESSDWKVFKVSYESLATGPLLYAPVTVISS